MLDDRERWGNRGLPFSHWARRSINHYRDEPDDRRVCGKGSEPPGGEGRQSLEQYQGARGALLGVVAWGSLAPPQGDPPWAGE